MAITVSVSGELRTWITHNLNRGCPPAELLKSMISQQFEPQIAEGLIGAFLSARAASGEPPEHAISLDVPVPAYQYETPHLAPGNVLDAGDRQVAVAIRVAQPFVAVLENVLSADECTELIELARPRLVASTVVDPQTGANTQADYRRSEGMFFRPAQTELIARLDRRLARLMNYPVENGEGLQVLRYGVDGHTAPHFDFLIPTNATNEASLRRSGQRLSTLLIYLNDVPRGGETIFPEIGLSVVPRRGTGVYFEYTNSHNQVDPRTLHAGTPVLEGEKWAVTKWMRTRRFIPAPG